MLVNRDLIHRWLTAVVRSPAPRRWLTAVVHFPVPRRPLVVATALTAAAAVAAGAAGAAGGDGADGAAQARTVAAADAAAPDPDRGTAATAEGSAGTNDRSAKIGAARKKAAREKAERVAAKGEGRRSTSVPSERDLMPGGTPGAQSSFQPGAEQVRNAERIIRTGERMNMPPRAQVIAVATALQESKLENLGHLGARNDHDSLGLFQQRPSTGWGRPEQLTDPDYAAEQFYRGLQRVPGYTGQPLTRAAQAVQVSAFPDAYAQWEKMAADLVLARHGEGPYAGIAHGNIKK